MVERLNATERVVKRHIFGVTCNPSQGLARSNVKTQSRLIGVVEGLNVRSNDVFRMMIST